MTLLQHHILALSLTAITTFGLGLLVFLAEPRRRLNQIFGLYSLAISWWALSETFFVGSPDYTSALFWAFMEWFGVIFIAPTFFHTIVLFTEEEGKATKNILTVAYSLSIAFLICHFLVWPDPLRPVAYLHWFSTPTFLRCAIGFTFLILVNIGLWKLGYSYRHAIDHRRIQLKYLFWGSIIGYLGGSPDWFLVFGFSAPGFNPFGIYCVPMYSIATTYAVLHHRLFDVHLVIRRSLVYSVLVTLLTVGYFVLVYVTERVFQSTFGYQSSQISLIAFALMALVFQPLKLGIQQLVDRLFFRVPQEELARRLERLEQQTQQTEKLKAVATLAAGMAHEIKNPLSSIKTFAEFLPQKYDDPSFREKFARIINQEVGKINELVQRLLDFAKPAEPQKQPVRMAHLMDETIELLHGRLLNKHIEVVRAYTYEDNVLVDAGQMKQVFLNVLLNGIEAITEHGCISIATVAENSHVEIVIADTGPGIPRKELSRVFDPFYTTKSDGTGLGLSVVHSIIQEHGGRVAIDSDTGRGTTVRIQLPLTQGTQDPRHET